MFYCSSQSPVTTCAECKIVNTAMADDSVWPWPCARTVPCSQPGQADSACLCLLFTAGNGEVMNETASFIDAGVVVRLCHQSGITRQSFTVRNVRGTSSHRYYYQTDLQHLRSLVGKTSSTTRSPFLIQELTTVNWRLTGHQQRVKFNSG